VQRVGSQKLIIFKGVRLADSIEDKGNQKRTVIWNYNTSKYEFVSGEKRQPLVVFEWSAEAITIIPRGEFRSKDPKYQRFNDLFKKYEPNIPKTVFEFKREKEYLGPNLISN
jgi:hypothetical protein